MGHPGPFYRTQALPAMKRLVRGSARNFLLFNIVPSSSELLVPFPPRVRPCSMAFFFSASSIASSTFWLPTFAAKENLDYASCRVASTYCAVDYIRKFRSSSGNILHHVPSFLLCFPVVQHDIFLKVSHPTAHSIKLALLLLCPACLFCQQLVRKHPVFLLASTCCHRLFS